MVVDDGHPKPMITVLMTAYKGGNYFKDAVRSILDQTFWNLELLVILDPHPEDMCEAVLKSMEDPRIRLLKNKRREGLLRSRNIGLSGSRGEYIAIMDSDDISLPERLQRQLKYLQNNRDCGLVGSYCTVINAHGDVLREDLNYISDTELYYRFTFANQIPHSSILARKGLVLEVGGYREDGYGEDYELYLKCIERQRIHKLPEVLVKWREHPGSTSGEYGKKIEGDSIGIIKDHVRRRFSIELSDKDVRLFRDHSMTGFSLKGVRIALKKLRLLNSSVVETAPEWADRKMLRKLANDKYLALLTGQILNQGWNVSIPLFLLSIPEAPGMLIRALRRIMVAKREKVARNNNNANG